jgi:ribosomal subunit interface protein
MDIRIQSIHFDASEQLQAFIQKKVSKLEKYYEDIKKVEVSLKVVKPEAAEKLWRKSCRHSYRAEKERHLCFIFIQSGRNSMDSQSERK